MIFSNKKDYDLIKAMQDLEIKNVVKSVKNNENEIELQMSTPSTTTNEHTNNNHHHEK